MWPRAVENARYDINTDPVFTNNAILPCGFETFSWETLSYLKELASA
jgi:hypothetical protein